MEAVPVPIYMLLRLTVLQIGHPELQMVSKQSLVGTNNTDIKFVTNVGVQKFWNDNTGMNTVVDSKLIDFLQQEALVTFIIDASNTKVFS